MTVSHASPGSSLTVAPPPGVWGDREDVLPLLVGLIVAVALHALAIVAFSGPSLVQWMHHSFTPTAPVKETNPAPLKSVAAKPGPPAPPDAARANPSKPLAAMPRPALTPVQQHPLHPAQKLPRVKNDVRFGRDHGDPTSIAWIGYDDYQQLIARKGLTEQPALQKDAEPLPGAPIRPDPSPGHPAIAARPGAAAQPLIPFHPVAPVSPPAPPIVKAEPSNPVPFSPGKTASVQSSSPGVQPASVVTPPEPQPAPTPVHQSLADAGQKLPIVVAPTRTTEGLAVGEPAKPAAMVTPVAKPVDVVKPTPALSEQHEVKPAAAPTVAAQSPSKPAEPAIVSSSSTTSPSTPTSDAKSASVSASPAVPGESARPTGAPRSDSESFPVSLTGEQKVSVRPGGVLAGEGIEIKTAVPRFDVAVRFSSPRNPLVRVVFSKEGNVIDAEIIKSSEYANVDGPVLASLYRWRASGKKLAELNRSFEVTISIILVDE